MLKINALKLNMSQVFLDNGKVVPVTILKSENDLTPELLNQIIMIVGTSKGKGFTGVMKKWNFAGQQATRGQSDRPRAAGAIGGQTPGRVFLGKKMAGRHGNKRVTLKNITILNVDVDNKLLTVSGPIPGARNSKVELHVEGLNN
jgi:large subunit ribosomal protein L3